MTTSNPAPMVCVPVEPTEAERLLSLLDRAQSESRPLLTEDRGTSYEATVNYVNAFAAVRKAIKDAAADRFIDLPACLRRDTADYGADAPPQAVQGEAVADRCTWWIEPGNGLTSVTPGHTCTRKAVHGRYCGQHAKMAGTPAMPIAASGDVERDALWRMFRAIVDAGGPETIARHGVERGSDKWKGEVRAGLLAIERMFHPERFDEAAALRSQGQAVAVDDAMVERAFAEMRRYDCFFVFPNETLKRLIREWITAALAQQAKP